MPPKGRGRPRRPDNTLNISENVFDTFDSDSASLMDFSERQAAKGKQKAGSGPSETGRTRRSRATKESKPASAVPPVFQDLLAESLSSPNVDVAGRSRKRRKTRQPGDVAVNSSILYENNDESHGDDGRLVEFEDLVPPKQEQTAYNDTEGGSSESDFAWEDIGMTGFALEPYDVENDEGDLDLTLTTEKSPQRYNAAPRRKALTKAERNLRLNTHKMHLLCLLSHVDRRNNWCNDSEVQSTLKPLLTKQIMECLKPKESYTQFGRAESVKKGLSLITKMWESKYNIVAKGMQRPFWAENEQVLQESKPSPESDSLHEKSEFKVAGKELKGSRDVGAQLFCALLRSAGLEVRLVFSLQPLPFSAASKAAAPNGPRASPTVASVSTADMSGDEEPVKMHSKELPSSSSGPAASRMLFTARQRLGHPNAADYFMPLISSPVSTSPKSKAKHKRIRESPFPVFWVEVLDEAHQKWMPVNPMDTTSVNSPRMFEPPASDSENNMSYVIAFEDDGAARDVTRRYTKMFSAKTRKNRVESTEGGDRWWRRTMRFYSRGWKSDLDQIEDTELAAAEAREPMPKSVADFKAHPVYALERHLRRNEVLVNSKEVGKVAAGRDAGGRKRLESVYRRRDVKLVKSADGWYRVGCEVKVGEQPMKIVAPRKQGDELEDGEENAGTALYAESQTELYTPPPIVNGRVPKNSYGNLDVYVPTMVPAGGVHIPDPEASRAARMLGLDYADAVIGFEFRGRHGTAIVKGIVAAVEYKQAVEAIIEGFRDEQAQAEEEMRSLAALRMWKRFVVGLRIKERVDGYEIEGEDVGDEPVEDDSGMESEEYIDDGGGGFFPSDAF